MRQVDTVSVKGSEVPLELWTFDITNIPDASMTPEIDPTTGEQRAVSFAHDAVYKELQVGRDNRRTPVETNK